MAKPIYIHYGHDEFLAPDPIVNRDYFTKPRGGLWASRKYGTRTWVDWCRREEFRLDTLYTSFQFVLDDKARVLNLYNEDQLDSLPRLNDYRKEDEFAECHLDFEELKKQYDAVEVIDIANLYWRLYGWDCNSILIMNPKIVEVIDHEKKLLMI